MLLRDEILKDAQRFEFKSFGDLNPDKYFLVIQQEGSGRGLFSLLSSVLCYLDFADKFSLTPVIDFENFKTVYNEKTLIHHTKNAFDYYFEPINKYDLNEVYHSKQVFLTGSGYPSGYNYSVTNVENLYQIWKKYIKLKPYVLAEVENKQQLFSSRTLGVHFRGQEMRTAAGHWFPPTVKQIFYAIDKMTIEYGFNKIFLVTEDSNLLNTIVTKYGARVVSNSHYRTAGENAYKQYPRENHRYLLGLEILIDMILLSKCQGLIHCTSNVGEMAKFVNNGKYTCMTKINNGPNSSFWPLARILWYIKNLLPQYAGGFKVNDNVCIFRKCEQL